LSLGFKKAGFEILGAAEWDCNAAVTYVVNLCRYGEFKIHVVENSDEERLEKYLSKEFKKKDGHLGGGHLGWSPAGFPINRGGIFPAPAISSLATSANSPPSVSLRPSARKRAKLVTGGPPCQGLSQAGQQNVMDPRNSLVFEFARLVVGIRPKTFSSRMRRASSIWSRRKEFPCWMLSGAYFRMAIS
jgi:DNA (cytosine-5)-methyltransferase 1